MSSSGGSSSSSGLSLKFILQVVDQASGPIGKVRGQLQGLAPAAGQVASSTKGASQGVSTLGTAATKVGGLSQQVIASNSNFQAVAYFFGKNYHSKSLFPLTNP
ncbi:MAG: hypothetical protein WA941_05605 [Nitrososphaeraceae archaeon]